jgi:predicted DNA-binding protein
MNMTTKTVTVRLNVEAKNALALEAERRGCAIADVIRDAVSQHLNKTHEADRLAQGFANLAEEIRHLEKTVLEKIDTKNGGRK